MVGLLNYVFFFKKIQDEQEIASGSKPEPTPLPAAKDRNADITSAPKTNDEQARVAHILLLLFSIPELSFIKSKKKEGEDLSEDDAAFDDSSEEVDDDDDDKKKPAGIVFEDASKNRTTLPYPFPHMVSQKKSRKKFEKLFEKLRPPQQQQPRPLPPRPRQPLRNRRCQEGQVFVL